MYLHVNNAIKCQIIKATDCNTDNKRKPIKEVDWKKKNEGIINIPLDYYHVRQIHVPLSRVPPNIRISTAKRNYVLIGELKETLSL